MSQTGEQSRPLDGGGGEEEEENDSEETPITALAPASPPQEILPTNISSNPAIQNLNELFSLGKISGIKMANLKASFDLLHETLTRSQESEIRLLQEAKRFRVEREKQRRELQRAEGFPEGAADTEVGRTRQQLLKVHNDLRLADDRDYQLQYQIECLQEKKTCLEQEYETQPKPIDLEKRQRDLTESCEEMRREISQRRLEIQSLKEDMEAKQKQMQTEQHLLDDKKDIVDNKEAELAHLLSTPGQLGKEIERISRRQMETEKRKAALGEQLEELAELQRKTEAQCRALEEERREVVKEREARRAHLEAAEREHNILLKELEMAKEKEAILMGQRGLLDVNLGLVAAERKSVHQSLAKKARESERQLRGLKKMQLQMKLAQDTLDHIQSQHSKTQSTRDAFPNDDSSLQRRNELQKEVENLKQNWIQQQSLSAVEAEVMEQCMQQEQALIKQSHRHREELHHLHCLTLIKAEEREQKSRELLRAQVRYNRIKQELKGKGLVIQEHKKQNQEIHARLSVFAKLYDIIKGERNKYLSLIQMAGQRGAEMREKFKILENEIEILRTAAINKDKLLQKSRLRRAHSHTARDRLRNDMSDVTRALREMRQKREEQKLDLGQLAYTIRCQEEVLLQTRQNHEDATRKRNERGLQLVEREEEICIFYERVNVHTEQIRDGHLELQAMEEEIRHLSMLLREESRQLGLCRQQVACKRSLEQESTMLQIQLSECQDQTLSLEKALTDPAQENRMRLLDGKDLSLEELLKKIEELEGRLVEKEDQLLEKEMVDEEVTRLTQHVRTKAENGKEDTLTLAKKVNELQSRIKASTRQMTAVVAELAMRQAEALVQQKEVRERELQVEACRRRMEQGLSPSDDAEQEWERYVRHERRRRAEAVERAKLTEEEERNQLPGGVYTTAEARPNAYIPEGAMLSLPKPYGAWAPFKPSEPGANARHIRKPQLKPIQI